MTYNYTNLSNQALENMLPIFGAMTNGAHHQLATHPNFLNQLATSMNPAAADVGGVNATPASNALTSTTAPATAVAAATATAPAPAAMQTKRDHNASETPIVPRINYSATQRTKVKPNQGAAPMDLENDLENETTNAGNATSSQTNITPTKMIDELAAAMHDTNLFINNLVSNLNSGLGYMVFPSGNPSTTPAATTSTAAATGTMLMDPSSMMAAAMRQMQHNYAAGYGPMPDGEEHFNGPPLKEMIKTKSCMLFPPNPNAPPPTIRERPPGCRTVFVGGLPENITEEIIREIFESCGEITTLRMSKKNFCHIRYRHEVSIDRAIFLSGYRVRILNTNEAANFGRLHVDYAQARDDQYDYECKQRQLQREQRHRERMSLERLRSQSPPPMPHYTDHEAAQVAESLRNNETFLKAVQTITIWLERGDCNKRNANIFYSMIQITHGHVRHLHTDKQQLEDDLRKARENYRKQMLTMSTQ